MSELTLLILRISFLIALWVFVFFVVYAVRSDLFGQRVRRLPSQGSDRQGASSASAANAFLTSATPRIPAAETDIITSLASTSGSDSPLRLVIVSGDKAGQELPLTGDPITIGRSSDSSLVIKDDYTSTHHARLEIRGGTWILRDLDSTNGTLLGGVRVTSPTPVPLNIPITIGATSFEVRR
ncbi:MAG: FHA domain-containing protein [Actinomycetales bacterium]|nr:FHA domain-containing protein [Actinomycetales bacterium]